jgi:hypothetical protein
MLGIGCLVMDKKIEELEDKYFDVQDQLENLWNEIQSLKRKLYIIKYEEIGGEDE